jgi:hypothetical protein
MPSFLTRPLITMPSSPLPAGIEWSNNYVSSATTSPFSQQQQVYDWQAGMLEGSVSWAPLMRSEISPLLAFIAALHGVSNVFQMGDPLGKSPLGTPSGTPLVNGSGQSGFSLATKGWTAGAPNVLLAGDWIQIGYRLYQATASVTADGSGNATIPIWPQLRSDNWGGTVNTSGFSVFWQSGSFFPYPSTLTTITINGVQYPIASINSSTAITLSLTAGTQTGVNCFINETPPDSTPIITSNTQGLWCLSETKQKWSVSEQDHLYRVSFGFREAI